MAFQKPSWETNTQPIIKPSWEATNSFQRPSWETGQDNYKPAPITHPPQPPQQGGIFDIPTNLSLNRQQAYDWMNERLPGFLKPVNNAIANITQRFDDSALGKFIHRGSQTANAIGFGADNENRPSTGNKVADVAADIMGGAAGIFAPNGLGKFSMMASEAAKVPQFASKMASKIKSPAVANVAKGAIENAGAGMVYGITEGIVNDRTPGEIAGNIALDTVIGAGVGIGIEALRPVVSKVLSKYKGMPINPETVEREVAKDIGVDWDNLNDRQKDAIRKVVTGMQTEPVQSGRLLYPAQEFTFRDLTTQDKLKSLGITNQPLALPPAKEIKSTFIDDVYNKQYNDIKSIRKQLAKYYSAFDEEALDNATGAIADLEATERRFKSEGLRTTSGEFTNNLRGDTGTLSNKPYKTIGLSFSRDLIDTGKVNLTGHKISDTKELATIAQVFRDPRFETLRIIFTRGNQVVGIDALSSRIPGAAVAFLDGKARFLQKTADRMKRIGADGYYLLHNHPSGKNVKPSSADIAVTQEYANRLPGFKGHIIINSNKYTEISPVYNGFSIGLVGREDLPLNLGNDRLLTPSIQHELLGKRIASSSELAQAAKALQIYDDVSVAFFLNSQLHVTGIQEISNSMIRNSKDANFRNFLRRQAVEHGGNFVSIVGDRSVAKELQELVASEDLLDGLIKDIGLTFRTTQPVTDPWMGLDIVKQGERVSIPKPNPTPPLAFNTQVLGPLEKGLATQPPEIPPYQFKQTVEVPRVYDRSSQGLPQNTARVDWQPPEPVTAFAEQTAQELYNADDLRDLSGFRLYSTDIYRNFRDVFGPHFEKVKKAILDPFDASKKANVEMQREWARKLKEEVVDRLGIQKGSELSALVQRYGEKNISLPELQKLRPKDWQKVVEADRWFRWAYDQLLNEVNAVRVQIYPNNPEKIIPRRQDYYRHFRELADTLEGVKNLFETPSAIDPSLAGRSEFTLPKSKFLSFAQKRGFGPYKEDAVGGFLNYLPAASYAKHIDPHIGQFERLAAELAGATEKSRHLNNFIEWLRDYARDLAGKTNPADRFAQKIVPGGRTTFKVLNWLNSRIKANVVMGNISSSLSQIANVPQGIAFAKQYSVPGFKRTIKSIFKPAPEIAKSGFLTERFSSDIYRQFDTKLMDQPKKFAAWMLEVVDKVGTEFIWNSVYEKALAEGIPNPIKYADDMTRSLVAGRGIGEVPILQKSKIMQLVAPFTLEVSNLWKVQKDFVKARDFGGLVALYVANFMLNKAMEATRGSGVVFDPIDATIEALTEEDISPLQRAGRLAGEVVSNLPLGSTIASIYPEYGTDTLPTRKELFGRNDPTRFGPGLLAAKGLSDPLYKVLPGFGGGQIQKTVRGVSALAKGGAYTSDGTKLKYPVKRTPANIVRGVLFGQYSFPEAKEYYENNRRPLGENQTQMYQKSSNPDATYRMILREREIDKINRQISELNKDKSLSLEQKREKYQKLVERRKKLMQGGLKSPS